MRTKKRIGRLAAMAIGVSILLVSSAAMSQTKIYSQELPIVCTEAGPTTAGVVKIVNRDPTQPFGASACSASAVCSVSVPMGSTCVDLQDALMVACNLDLSLGTQPQVHSNTTPGHWTDLYHVGAQPIGACVGVGTGASLAFSPLTTDFVYQPIGGLQVGRGQEVVTTLTKNACTTDIDGNGTTNVSDFLVELGAFGVPCSAGQSCRTDLNADGITDIFDTLILGNAWNESCTELLTDGGYETNPLSASYFRTDGNNWTPGQWNAENAIIDATATVGVPPVDKRMLQIRTSSDVVSNVSQLADLTGKVPAGSSMVTCTYYVRSATPATITSFLVVGTGINLNPLTDGVLGGQTAAVFGPTVNTSGAGGAWVQASVSRPIPAGMKVLWFDVELVNQGAPVDGAFVDRASCFISAVPPVPALSGTGRLLLAAALVVAAAAALRLAARPKKQIRG